MAWDVPQFQIPVRVNIGEQIAAIPDAYAQGQRYREVQNIRDARRTVGQQPLGLTPEGRPNYAAPAQQLLSAGDLQGAQVYSGLDRNAEDAAYRRAMDARQAAQFQQTFAAGREDAANAQQSREAAIARQGMPPGYEPAPSGGARPIPGGPADSAAVLQSRIPAALAAGLREGTPEFKQFLLTGRLPTPRAELNRPPAGYQWNADETSLVAIPGGPAEKIDAEVAARLGLTKSFLTQLPEIKSRVESGALTGPVDSVFAKFGIGDAGEIKRQIASGQDALLRNLTGAGMPESEAQRYADRYGVNLTDSPETILSKLRQLNTELRSSAETLGRGRGGSDFITSIPSPFPAPPPTGNATVIPPGGAGPTKSQARALQGDPNLMGPSPAGADAGASAPMRPGPDTPMPRQGSDGNWYVPDPNRPGKYMKVVR